MKKNYLTPEVQVNFLVIENSFLASGESFTSRDYGSGLGEDEECFWE